MDESKYIGVKAPKIIQEQIEALAKLWGTNTSQTLIYAISLAYFLTVKRNLQDVKNEVKSNLNKIEEK